MPTTDTFVSDFTKAVTVTSVAVSVRASIINLIQAVIMQMRMQLTVSYKILCRLAFSDSRGTDVSNI